MELKLHKGRPKDIEGRLPKEIKCYDFLDELSIDYERVDHEVASTIEACKEIDEILSPAFICKNLFLCNAQKTKFYLLLISPNKQFKTKDVSKQIGSARLSFASAEHLEELLDITPGSVTILGLMNDTEKKVNLVIDSDLLAEEYIGCHPLINTSSLRIKTEDILDKFLKKTGHDYVAVEIKAVD